MIVRAVLEATSPASASTVVAKTITGLGSFRSMVCYAKIQGGTGGVLDIYIQFLLDDGTTWVDYAHFTQLAAGAAQIQRLFSTSREGQQTTIATVGSGTTPALAAGTVIGGDFGDKIRILFVAGASTSAGAAQTINFTFKD